MLKVILFVCAGIAVARGNCGLCPKGPLLYKELQCTGVYEEAGDCCPVRWDCPSLANQDPSKCHYNGKSYEVGDDIIDRVDCAPPCTCRRHDESAPAEFVCTHIDCPEYLGGYPLKPGCTRTYSPHVCCTTGEYCDKDRATLHKCHYRGLTVYKGEKFYPETDPCYSCVCDENFQDDTFVWLAANSRNCHQIECGSTLHDMDKILAKCAPVFFGKNTCCPYDWLCPATLPNAQIIPSDIEGRASLVCEFGDLKVKHFEGIETNDKCRNCTCYKPPFLTCSQTADCN